MACTGESNGLEEQDNSCTRMENNEVYEGSSISLHTIPSADTTNAIGNKQHGDLHARFPGEVLDLSNRGLSEDNEKALGELLDGHKPKALILDYNSFTELPDSIPRESLRVVSIAGQFDEKKGSLERRPIFQSIPESINRASNLTDLLVPNNGLDHLPHLFIHLHNLTRINFMCNHFREFPLPLFSLTGLREINLSANCISEIPSKIANLTRLEILRVSNNRLRRLPPEIGELGMLSQLSVRNNFIKQLPVDITRCAKLEDTKKKDGGLFVEGNPLTYPPVSVKGTHSILDYLKRHPDPRSTGDTESLEQIAGCYDVSGKALQELPVDLPSSCTAIHAQRNNLSQLPNFPEGLGVEHLLLDDNALVDFPLDPLKTLPQLKTLSLTNQTNMIGENLNRIPRQINHLTKLQVLILSQNNIAVLPDSLFQCSELRVLDLSHNKLTSLPAAIQQANQLEVLDVSDNALDALPPAMGQLQALRVLSVSNNKLTEFPEELCQLRQLQTLSLRGNLLERLPLEFHQLQQLAEVAVHKVGGYKSFPSGCLLDDNPRLAIPEPAVLQQGIRKVLDEMKFFHDHPHLYPTQGSDLVGRGRRALSSHTLTDQYLRKLAADIGGQWREVGRALFKPKDLDSWCSSGGGGEEACLHLLTTWRNTGRQSEEVMVSKLQQALRHANLPDLADHLNTLHQSPAPGHSSA